VIVVVLYLMTRELFDVPFEWGRLSAALAICVAGGAGGAALLPSHGADAFAIRLLIGAAIPVLLVATRVVPREQLLALARPRRAQPAG